jgi:uncharacterized protein (TIGR02246 family)
MKSTFSCIVISTALLGFRLAVFADDVPAEKAAVAANDRAYEAAYAKGDYKTLAGYFTEDAEYTTDEGRTFVGRAEIEETIRKAFTTNKGAKLVINLDSVRVLGPEAVLEKGTTTVTSKNGEVDSELYTAIHIKTDGKWKINQLIESPLPDQTPREHLTELDWLVGHWEDTDKTDNTTVHSEYLWARGGNFLTRNITVKNGNDVILEGFQIIGWDPVEENIHAWTFDTDGGYAEGRFTHDGNRWLLRENGYTPEGSRMTADNTITRLSTDKFTWESNNRTLDGEPQPSISKIEIGRVKGK